MPAPVAFSITLAPFPGSYDLSPQQFAQALVDRLTIAPSEPWSSFINGGTGPTSDVGPWLKNSQEWMVWDSGTGTYISHVQDGSGLRDATVTIAKLAPWGFAGSLLASNGSLVPTELPVGTVNQVLTSSGTAPGWAALPTPATNSFFEVTRAGSNQQLDTSAGFVPVVFNSVKSTSADVTFDTSTGGLTVHAGEIWFLYTNLQIEDTGAASTGVQINLQIHGSASPVIGTVYNATTMSSRLGMHTSGVVKITADDVLYVYIDPSEDTPVADGMEVADNNENTRFGGFRIA